jgi:tripartite-type tricarboxylate transporter receptor subunit TctC
MADRQVIHIFSFGCGGEITAQRCTREAMVKTSKDVLHAAGRFATLLGAMWIASSAMTQPVFAQAYPGKPLRVVIPFPPGGPTDLFARLIAQKLGESLGQKVVVDNRPGAGGIIGLDIVAKSAPDGYTLFFSSATSYLAPVFYKTTPFNLVQDFAPVMLVLRVPEMLVVHPSLPANTVRELIALAKTRPGQISFASGGNFPLLVYESWRRTAGIETVVVPYKGAGPAITELIGGQVHMTMLDAPVLLPYVESKRLRAIAVSSSQRMPSLPNLPTIAEAGFPGVSGDNWYAIVVPAATPKEIVSKLHSAHLAVITAPDLKARLVEQHAQIIASTPREFEIYMRDEIVKWTRVAKAAGIQPE